MAESTSIGAAVTAGVGIGVYKGFEEVKRFLRFEGFYKPTEKNVEIYNRLKPIFDQSYYSLSNIYEQIEELEQE